MIPLTFLLTILSPFAASHDLNPPKYLPGDCITPITHHWSWIGEYALVEDFSSSMKYRGTHVYSLTFPNRESATGPYEKVEIDENTIKVSLDYCKPTNLRKGVK